ncbi:MAG TPA: LD-carboxypeptidase [Levilinea sp.]|nr:LD-carboxypeptidase [Levilinea sp.]
MEKILRPARSTQEGTGLRHPSRLKPADMIGIVSTSSPVNAEMVDRTRCYFEARGYRVRTGAHVLERFGYMAGAAELRAGDLNEMLSDPDVRMIVTATGGDSAIQMLPLIYYGTLSLDPKIICGLSDPSILLNALTARSGVPTFHGPNGFDFGGGITAFTEQNYWPLVTGQLSFPHRLPVEAQVHVLRAGPAVQGWLWGGHLATIQGLLGTPYLPQWGGAILFLEEFQVDYARTDAMLAHFRHAGIFDRIRALIVGQPVEIGQAGAESYEELILRNCAGTSFPIVANVPLGHTPNKITLPIGGKVRLDTSAHRLELLDPVVA